MPSFPLEEGSIGIGGLRRIKETIISISSYLQEAIDLNNEIAIVSNNVIFDMYCDIYNVNNAALDLNILEFDDVKLAGIANLLEQLRDNIEARIDTILESFVNLGRETRQTDIQVITMLHMKYKLSIAVVKMESTIVECEILLELLCYSNWDWDLEIN